MTRVSEQTLSLTDRLKAIGVQDAALLRDIQLTEDVAITKSITATKNNAWPRWSLDRWMLIGGFSAAVITNVFDLGGYRERMESRLQQTSSEVNRVGQKVDQIQVELVHIQVEQGRVRTELDFENSRSRPQTPRFSPEWQAGQ